MLEHGTYNEEPWTFHSEHELAPLASLGEDT